MQRYVSNKVIVYDIGVERVFQSILKRYTALNI